MSTREGSFFRKLDVRFPWLKIFLACFALIVMLLDFMGLTISRVKDPSDHIRVAPMAYHVKIRRDYAGKKLVALTFDDGPSSATTPRLLDILKEKEVYATFFMLGSKVKANPEIARRAKKEHHVVASHTTYHQNLIRIPINSARSDISETKDIFNNILGRAPVLTRPPYGNTNSAVSDAFGTPIILWSVDTLDWKSRNVDAILEVTNAEVHDGAIILLHDIYDTSVDAVPRIIDDLREKGYEFVTVPELAAARGVDLKNGTIYYNFRP